MPPSFREYNDDAAMLLPLDMHDWLSEDHLAYLVRDLVRNLDMTPFYRPYAGDGRRNRPYDPTMMMTVLIYAYEAVKELDFESRVFERSDDYFAV